MVLATLGKCRTCMYLYLQFMKDKPELMDNTSVMTLVFVGERSQAVQVRGENVGENWNLKAPKQVSVA